MLKFIMLFIFFFNLLNAKTFLIETESSEEENVSESLEGDEYILSRKKSGNDYRDCKNLRECLTMKEETMGPSRIDPLGKGK